VCDLHTVDLSLTVFFVLKYVLYLELTVYVLDILFVKNPSEYSQHTYRDTSGAMSCLPKLILINRKSLFH